MTSEARKQLHEHLAKRRLQWQERSPDMCGPDGFGSNQGPAATPLTGEFWFTTLVGMGLLSTLPTLLALFVVFCCGGKRNLDMPIAVLGAAAVLGAIGMAWIVVNGIVRIMETRSYLICSPEEPHTHSHTHADGAEHSHAQPHSHSHTHADGLVHSHTHTDHGHTHEPHTH